MTIPKRPSSNPREELVKRMKENIVKGCLIIIQRFEKEFKLSTSDYNSIFECFRIRKNAKQGNEGINADTLDLAIKVSDKASEVMAEIIFLKAKTESQEDLRQAYNFFVSNLKASTKDVPSSKDYFYNAIRDTLSIIQQMYPDLDTQLSCNPDTKTVIIDETSAQTDKVLGSQILRSNRGGGRRAKSFAGRRYDVSTPETQTKSKVETPKAPRALESDKSPTFHDIVKKCADLSADLRKERAARITAEGDAKATREKLANAEEHLARALQTQQTQNPPQENTSGSMEKVSGGNLAIPQNFTLVRGSSLAEAGHPVVKSAIKEEGVGMFGIAFDADFKPGLGFEYNQSRESRLGYNTTFILTLAEFLVKASRSEILDAVLDSIGKKILFTVRDTRQSVARLSVDAIKIIKEEEKQSEVTKIGLNAAKEIDAILKDDNAMKALKAALVKKGMPVQNATYIVDNLSYQLVASPDNLIDRLGEDHDLGTIIHQDSQMLEPQGVHLDHLSYGFGELLEEYLWMDGLSKASDPGPNVFIGSEPVFEDISEMGVEQLMDKVMEQILAYTLYIKREEIEGKNSLSLTQ